MDMILNSIDLIICEKSTHKFRFIDTV
uniref:Uncharacterized protein n=1 Tax=Anguilla anguilla TaxID=7936 RepID=A0A0E9W483_ANGAN